MSVAVRRNGKLRVLAKGPRALARLRDLLADAELELVHRSRLERARSLEHLLKLFGEGEIIYDPSGVATRAAATTAFVRDARAAMGKLLHHAMFDSATRRIVLVLARPRRARVEQVNRALHRAQEALRSLPAREWPTGFQPDLILTFATPAGRLVPIDRLSAQRLWLRQMKGRISGLVLTSAAGAALAASPAHAQVSGQVGGMGGVTNDEGAFGGEAVVVYNGPGAGFQLDGNLVEYDGETAGQIGSHLFLRDPDTGIIGVTARWADLGPGERWQIGMEAERFFGRFTITGEVGYEDSDFRDGDIYAIGGVGFYPRDHMSLYLVAGYTLGEPVAQASFEIQPAAGALPGLSLFADGGIGVSGEPFVSAGLRFTFGPSRSVIERDRRHILRRRMSPFALAPDSQS